MHIQRRIKRHSLSITPHQDRQHNTHSTPKRCRNLYHALNMMVISSIQNPHNFPCVLLRMHMRPLKMIQINCSVQIYNPLDPIHITSIEHFHSLFHWDFIHKYHINSNHFTFSSAASAAAAFQIPYSHQNVAAVVHNVPFLLMIYEIAMDMR